LCPYASSKKKKKSCPYHTKTGHIRKGWAVFGSAYTDVASFLKKGEKRRKKREGNKE